MITRFSDHGEMGLSHGGLRQKMFNAYEETIRVPLVISNPLLFPQGAESTTAASLVDVVPTLLSLAGAPLDGTLDGASLGGVLARHAAPEPEAVRASGADFGGVLDAAPTDGVRDHSLFTFDDHQAGTAQQDTIPAAQPDSRDPQRALEVRRLRRSDRATRARVRAVRPRRPTPTKR